MGDEVYVIYLDYMEAFDKLDQSVLRAKLNRYGICVTFRIYKFFCKENRQLLQKNRSHLVSLRLVVCLNAQSYLVLINNLLETLDLKQRLHFF